MDNVCPNCEARKKLFPEDILMELVLGYVNDVKDHRIDKQRLAGQISNIIGDIETLATEVEDGEFEEPPYEPNFSMSRRGK